MRSIFVICIFLVGFAAAAFATSGPSGAPEHAHKPGYRHGIAAPAPEGVEAAMAVEQEILPEEGMAAGEAGRSGAISEKSSSARGHGVTRTDLKTRKQIRKPAKGRKWKRVKERNRRKEAHEKGPGLSIAAFSLGIVAILALLFSSLAILGGLGVELLVGLVLSYCSQGLGALAVACGALAESKQHKAKGLAIAGIAMGIIAFLGGSALRIYLLISAA